MKILHRLFAASFALALCSVAPAMTAGEVIDRIVGNYAFGDTSLHATRVELKHTNDAVYLELITKGQETQVRQMVLTFDERDGSVVARTHAFPEQIGEMLAPDLPLLTIGLWAAPEQFPALFPSQLDPVADTVVEITSDRVRIAFEDAPVVLLNALLLDFDLGFSADGAEWTRVGTDAAGEVVWEERATFERVDIEPPVTRHENGMVTIDIRKGDGVALTDGDQIAFDFVGVLDDGRRFDSTQFEGRSLYTGEFPGRLLPNLAEGLKGIECPTKITEENIHMQPIRKVILPPELAFGPGVGPIPADAKVYYLAMVQSVRDRTPDADTTE